MKIRNWILIISLLPFLNVDGTHAPYYGILNAEDLLREASWAEPKAIITNAASFNTWQCFHLNKLKMECNLTGSEGPLNFSEPNLKIVENNQEFEFETRRPVETETCEDTLNKWREVFRGERITCISASYGSGEPSEFAGPWQRSSYWIINWVKTNHSHWSYFAEDSVSVK